MNGSENPVDAALARVVQIANALNTAIPALTEIGAETAVDPVGRARGAVIEISAILEGSTRPRSILEAALEAGGPASNSRLSVAVEGEGEAEQTAEAQVLVRATMDAWRGRLEAAGITHDQADLVATMLASALQRSIGVAV